MHIEVMPLNSNYWIYILNLALQFSVLLTFYYAHNPVKIKF